MTTIYGKRWKTLDAAPLGQGGQGRVFRVIDLRDEQRGEFALKRVLNPERRERFRSEIEAIKRLDHPSIVKLVDHSALDAVAGEEKQFLVMPIAGGGDLSRGDRLSLYKGSIDAVLNVARQIASGLKAAHAAGIVHRDIKPENLLFQGIGHDVWISDFGICLLRENPRVTETGEIVGPRAFMAPELEDGGQLEVTPAADVYSLGKVIYYMISGGVVVPRERLHEETYAGILRQGERHRLLSLLLEQMVCPLDRRLNDMDVVIRKLEAIEAWEQNARLIPISETGLASIERLQNRAQEARRISTENLAAREQERSTATRVKDTFEAWLRAELEKTAAIFSNGGELRCEVGELSAGTEAWRAAYQHDRWYAAVTGFELRLEVPSDPSARKHLLQIRLCQGGGIEIRVHAGGRTPTTPIEPVRDLQFAMIPYYRQLLPNRHPTQSGLMGFFSKKSAVGAVRGQLLPAQRGAGRQMPVGIQSVGFQSVRVEPVTGSFHSDVSQCADFRASDWPAVAEQLRIALIEATDAFASFVEAGAARVGP